MREKKIKVRSLTEIQRVFLNSRVNGAKYDEDELPVTPRHWPRRTFLQRRLAELRAAALDSSVEH